MKKIALSLIALMLACAFVLVDQGDPVPLLREKIDAFNKKYHRNKLDLFFNQPKYSPGDTALLRTLYLKAVDLRPVEGRQIIHLELFDPKGTRVYQNQILAVNGMASNALIIPDKFLPGIYVLVAYSDWMRNLDQSLFFKQTFLITGKETLQGKTAGAAETELNFYPEGGTWVAGIENNLVFQIAGNPTGGTASIKAGADEVATVKFDGEGLADVKFTPRQNVRYTAELVIAGQIKKVDLPDPKAEGFSTEVLNSTGTDPMKLRLRPTAGVDLTKKYFLVITNSRGIIHSRAMEFVKNELVELSLPAGLPPGVAEVMLIDENKKSWLRRAIMINGKSDYAVKISQPKKLYATRENVDIDIDLVDNAGNPVAGHFAARVTNQDLLKDTLTAPSSQANLLLYSDVSAGRKLTGGTDNGTINRYLITQSCPWLNWDKILADNTQPPQFTPGSTLTISGKAFFFDNGKPVPDSTQIMFFLQKQIFGYEITTSHDGSFNCPVLFDFAGTDEVFFAASHKGKDLNNISVKLDQQDTLRGFRATPWTQLGKDDAYGICASQKRIVDRSFSYFSENRLKKDSVADPNAAIEDELQGADLVLTVNDFILFPTMPDLIREVLRSVDYRRIGGRDVIRVYTTHKRPTNFAGPLYVIDGILTKSPSIFLNLKPLEIITIKVVKEGSKLAKFGTLGTNGVILVRTKNAGRRQTFHQENIFPLVGMSPLYNKPAPTYSTRAQSNPALKPCLFWTPEETIDVNGKGSIHFTTSDDVGNYKIHIEGITSDGRPFSAEEKFQVKYNRP